MTKSRKPITALRRVEADLGLLRVELRNLAREVARFDAGVQQSRRNLEALAARFKREFQGWKNIAATGREKSMSGMNSLITI
jgi:hypothetical protein